MEQTATLKLNKPAKGTFNWDVPLNENWDKLDCLGAGQMPLLGQLIVDRKLTGAEATGWALQGSVLDGNVYKSVYNILSAARGRAVQENRTIKKVTYTTYRDATTQLVFVDQSVYNNAFSALGDSIGYVINTSNKQITLPKRETFLRATVGKANLMDDESLPNIKGVSSGFECEEKEDKTNGAIKTVQVKTGWAGGSGGKPYMGIDFDASRSSSTYKDGALVRPRHTTVYIYYRVGNTIVNQEQIDVGNLTNQVNNLNTNKANKDFSNVASNLDFVTSSGTNWIRFKSGKLVQWGVASTPSGAGQGTQHTVTLPKAYANTSYSLANCWEFVNFGGGRRDVVAGSFTTTSFKWVVISASGNYDQACRSFRWITIGQGA